MNNENTKLGIDLSDKHARLYFYIYGYSADAEVDDNSALDGFFSYDLYETDEWGHGDFRIQKDSIHSIVRQLRSFIDSDQPEVHIDEDLKIDIVREKELFSLVFSMNDQLTEDYISVEKSLSYQELFDSLLKPLYSIFETYS